MAYDNSGRYLPAVLESTGRHIDLAGNDMDAANYPAVLAAQQAARLAGIEANDRASAAAVAAQIAAFQSAGIYQSQGQSQPLGGTFGAPDHAPLAGTNLPKQPVASQLFTPAVMPNTGPAFDPRTAPLTMPFGASPAAFVRAHLPLLALAAGAFLLVRK
jgi:hypothetical protein